MKLNFEIELTPEELREALGVPNVEHYYEEILESTLEKMRSGEDGYDPFSLLQPAVKNSFTNMEKAQEVMLSMMAGYMKSSNK